MRKLCFKLGDQTAGSILLHSSFNEFVRLTKLDFVFTELIENPIRILVLTNDNLVETLGTKTDYGKTLSQTIEVFITILFYDCSRFYTHIS